MHSHQTISVPQSVIEVADAAERLRRGGQVRDMAVIEMPCCGFCFDVEAIDCAPGPSRVFSPIQWTCPSCDRTWIESGAGMLIEVEKEKCAECETGRLDAAGDCWYCEASKGHNALMAQRQEEEAARWSA